MMRLPSKGVAVRLGVALAAAVALWIGIGQWLAGRSHVHLVSIASEPIDLAAAQWLRLAAMIPAFYAIRIWSLTDLSMLQQIVQASLRGLVIAGVALALARPVRRTETHNVAVVALVDVSDSVSDKQLEAAQRYVETLRQSKGNGHLQLIAFAERPAVVRSEPTSAASAAIQRPPNAGAGTDIQAAMQLAYGLFPSGYVPRLVVVSDGNQTAGDVATEAYRAKSLGVRVSWKAFEADPAPEVRVVGVSAPDDIKVEQPYEVTGEIWSNRPQTVTLALQQDQFPNPLEPTKRVDLREGKNLVKFKSEAPKAGHTTYRLRLAQAAHDTETKNNQAATAAPVKGRPNILYIEGSVSREPGTASHLRKALEHEGIDVEVRGPTGLPSTAGELEKYDLVLVSDVPAHLMGSGQMVALEGYVKNLGGGLIMAGGQDSFGSGGYERTVIENLMPVRFDSEKTLEQPHVALALVIDRSGSMQGAKLEAAKESARVTTEVLSPSDFISVVAFDSEASVLVRPQRAGNRGRISAEISRLQSGGGTNIYPALKEAFDILSGLNAKVKHVIVMTDGEAPTDGLAELVSDMRQSRITVSCVGVQGADRNLLAMIADAGEGRLYMVEDIGALPRIFMKETQEVQKGQLVEEAVRVRVAKNVEAIEGTNVDNAPPLRGYVATKPKPTAETILISDRGEPILARWRYGAGTSTAWTSDVKNRWSVDWIRWNGYPKFWAQVVRATMRRQVWDSYDLSATVADGQAQVTVDAIDSGDRFVNDLDTELQIIDPVTRKTIAIMPMPQTAAGRYTAEVALHNYGSFLLKAVHRRNGKTVAESLGSVALSYPLEYLRSTPNLEPLQQAALASGGHDQVSPSQLWNAAGERVTYTQELWPWVLLIVVGLSILDLYAKRVRLFGYRATKF